MDFNLDELKQIPDPFDDEGTRKLPARLPAPIIQRSAGTDRTTLRRRQLAALIIVLLIEVAWILRAGIAARPSMPALFGALAFGLPAVAALLGGLGFGLPGRLGLGLPLPHLLAALATAIAVFALSSLYAPELAMRDFTFRSTVACALTATMLGTLPFAVGYAMFRRTLPGAAWARMALLGVACGSLGALLVRLHCPKDSVAHILLGHGAAIVLFGPLGVWFGRRGMRI